MNPIDDLKSEDINVRKRNNNIIDKLKEEEIHYNPESSIVDDLKNEEINYKKDSSNILDDLKNEEINYVSSLTKKIIEDLKKEDIDVSTINLEVNDILDKNQLCIHDKSIQDPFVVSPELVKIIKNYTKPYKTKREKSRKIFEWMQSNIDYGKNKRIQQGKGYKNSDEVLKDKEGVCGEMAYLYISMARCCGIDSQNLIVNVDYKGKKVCHACAAIFLDGEMIQVDPAYHTYDIKHQKIKLQSDLEAMIDYNLWRKTNSSKKFINILKKYIR